MSSPVEGYMFDIRPSRVSLVKNPANKRKFLVTKSEDKDTMDEVIRIIMETEGANEDDLVKALKSADKDEGAVQAALSVYRTLNAFRDSLDESDLANIAKALDYETATEEEEVVEEVSAEADEEAEEVETAKTADNGKEAAEDAGNDAVNEVLETLRKKVAELEVDKRRAELREQIAGVQVGKSEDELVEMLVTIDNAGGDVDTMIETLKSVSTVASKSLFSAVGSDGPGEAGDEWEAIEKAAREIAKSEGVSQTKAIDLVGERHPELLEEYYKNQ